MVPRSVPAPGCGAGALGERGDGGQSPISWVGTLEVSLMVSSWAFSVCSLGERWRLELISHQLGWTLKG